MYVCMYNYLKQLSYLSERQQNVKIFGTVLLNWNLQTTDY